MNKKVLFAVCILVLIGAVSWGGFCVMRRMAEEKAAPVSLEKYPWEKVLNLTEAQRRDIKPLQEAFWENLAGVREKRVTEEMVICTLLTKIETAPSSKATGLKEIEAQTKKISEFQAKEQMLFARHLQEVGRFLTDSQRETFMNTIKQSLCRQTAASGLTTKDLCGMCGQGR